MAFISQVQRGQVYAPGWFLAHEECMRETREISASDISADEYGGKHVKMGTIYPSNDSNAVGIIYEDVDVTVGNMPGSVVTKGVVYVDRLPVTLSSNDRTALINKGFTFIETSPTATRPNNGTTFND